MVTEAIKRKAEPVKVAYLNASPPAKAAVSPFTVTGFAMTIVWISGLWDFIIPAEPALFFAGVAIWLGGRVLSRLSP